jgi:hypothetical protein
MNNPPRFLPNGPAPVIEPPGTVGAINKNALVRGAPPPGGAGVRAWLGQLAMYDKKLAYLMGCNYFQSGNPLSGMSWEIRNISGTFTALTANQIVNASIPVGVETDLWIQKITYTVQRPNAFAGSIFKAQSDEFNKLNPDIDFELIIRSIIPYVISTDFTPLENIPNVFECVCPAGLILTCAANVQARFQNIRTLAADENPTIVTISLHGRRLPLGAYSSCSNQMANNFLVQNGICENCNDDCE